LSQCNGFNFNFGVSSFSAVVVEVEGKSSGEISAGVCNTIGLDGVIKTGGCKRGGRTSGVGVLGITQCFCGGGGGGFGCGDRSDKVVGISHCFRCGTGGGGVDGSATKTRIGGGGGGGGAIIENTGEFGV
jgi:hypothetical protein